MLHGINEDLALPLMASRRKIQEGRYNLPAVKDRIIMITGAGGSIGSELVRQVASASPKQMILVDNSEENMYDVMATLAESNLSFPYEGCLVDVANASAVHKLKKFAPDLVIHAAALKHVPLLETEINLTSALRTNVFGTLSIMTTFHEADFVLVSTDKAVEPTSMMGMTKRLAELVVATMSGPEQKTAVVRFGNVLGSSGSVVPLFRRQIAQGGPVTITDFKMERYFMTIQQACKLVLTAATSAHGVDNQAPLVVLDMGEPVKIIELAHQLIRQMGLEPDLDIDVIETGIRPGEKLFEKLSYPEEDLTNQGQYSIGIIAPQNPDTVCQHLLNLTDTLAGYCLDMQTIAQLVDLSQVSLPEGVSYDV